MTPTTLRATLTTLGLSVTTGARALGMSRTQLTRYVNGRADIPRVVELAVEGLMLRQHNPAPQRRWPEDLITVIK